MPDVRPLRLILISACLYVSLAGLTLSLSGCGESNSEEQTSVTPTEQDEKTRQEMLEYEKSKASKKK